MRLMPLSFDKPENTKMLSHSQVASLGHRQKRFVLASLPLDLPFYRRHPSGLGLSWARGALHAVRGASVGAAVPAAGRRRRTRLGGGVRQGTGLSAGRATGAAAARVGRGQPAAGRDAPPPLLAPSADAAGRASGAAPLAPRRRRRRARVAARTPPDGRAAAGFVAAPPSGRARPH